MCKPSTSCDPLDAPNRSLDAASGRLSCPADRNDLPATAGKRPIAPEVSDRCAKSPRQLAEGIGTSKKIPMAMGSRRTVERLKAAPRAAIGGCVTQTGAGVDNPANFKPRCASIGFGERPKSRFCTKRPHSRNPASIAQAGQDARYILIPKRSHRPTSVACFKRQLSGQEHPGLTRSIGQSQHNQNRRQHWAFPFYRSFMSAVIWSANTCRGVNATRSC
jgi:hypothetical protein